MEEEYLTPDEAKAALHYDQARLARVEACEPEGALERWGWLSVRRTILGDLTDRVGALVAAWDSVGDQGAGDGAEELGEHYLQLYQEAERALEAHRPAAIAAAGGK